MIETILGLLNSNVISALLGALSVGGVAVWLAIVKSKARQEAMKSAIQEAMELQNKAQSEVLKNVQDNQKVVENNAALSPDTRRERLRAISEKSSTND